MIGTIFRWNRLVLPPWWAVTLFAMMYLFIESLCVYVGLQITLPGELNRFIGIRWSVVIAGAAVLGLSRFYFHPAYRREYRTWLACTPWTMAKPLPLGPVHLIPQDALIVVALMFLMLSTGKVLLLPAFAFLFAYELAMAMTLFITGQRWAAYGLVFCLSFGVWFVQIEAWGLVVVMLVYPLAYWAHMQCLTRFPWPKVDFAKEPLLAPFTNIGTAFVESNHAKNQRLGFPFEYLSPKQNVPSISVAEGTAISLLAGVWAHACLANAPTAEARTAISFFTCIAPVTAVTVVRLALYCGVYWPPISVFGRLTTGRFIIPRYDRVFVAPLIASIVSIPGCLLFQETSPVWGMPLVLTLGLWLNLNLGPKLLDWRLTGGHRLGLTLYRDRTMFAEP
jgi:hypothetical protein